VVILPLMLAALPLLDAFLAVIRRLRGGTSPLHGDRRHFYDLLFARGWSPRRVALTSYGIAAALALFEWASLRQGTWQFLLVSALCLGVLLIAGITLGVLRPGAVGLGVSGLRDVQNKKRLPQIQQLGTHQ
jgi:hypothetical protein